MWHREGSYDGIAEELFSTLRFDRLLLEYDTARAGGFEPLRFAPKGPVGSAPIVVLGLVTTKTGEVETWLLQGSGPGAYKANGISAAGVFPIGKTYTVMIAPSAGSGEGSGS